MVIDTCPSHRSGSVNKEEDVQQYKILSMPHVESFNYFLEVGLQKGIEDIEPGIMDIIDPEELKRYGRENIDYTPNGSVTSVKYWFENVRVTKPTKDTPSGTMGIRLCPRECRERGLMYSGQLSGLFCYSITKRKNGRVYESRPVKLKKMFGKIPIMVSSKACHLAGKTPKELVQLREEQNEFGGYFIVSGIERCMRMLQVPRRNFATAIQRSSYKNRGPTYTDLGVSMRCGRHNGDMSSITNTIHYLTTGGATMNLLVRKSQFLIPVILILRALSRPPPPGSDHHAAKSDMDDRGSSSNINAIDTGIGITDEELYKRLTQGDETNTFLRARAGLLLQDARIRFPTVNKPEECLAYLGERFRYVTRMPNTVTDVDVGHYVMRRYILIHLKEYGDKLECLLFMLRKLYSFAEGKCGVDNADSLQQQEILVPGHFISAFVKEKFEETLGRVSAQIVNDIRKDYKKFKELMLENTKYWGKTIDRASTVSSGGIGKKLATFLSTGNLISSTNLDLMQTSGYTIIAERLNFLRFCSHFRSVHRGQFFMEMRSTAVRKLLPDQWGFLCPVHTPDGGPCGLLSHLSIKAYIMNYPATTAPKQKETTTNSTKKQPDSLDQLLISLGVSPVGFSKTSEGRSVSAHSYLSVCLDGRVVGSAPPGLCKTIAAHLRLLKTEDHPIIPPTLEIAMIPIGNAGAPFPGLYMFTGAARMVRPVLQRATGKIEMIGPLEQGFMDIACLDEDVREGITTHQELDPTNMLSLIANMTPFSDQNQSPRNMYQCQMGKQTMGTPCQSYPYRTDNKLYRLQTPQAPVVQTTTHGEFGMDEHPNGTNAVVAVLSYTGFDMEDAMILNKSCRERGFGHASVYKTFVIDLEQEAKMKQAEDGLRFSNKRKDDGTFEHKALDADGLPAVGECVTEGDKLYCLLDAADNNSDHTGKHKEREKAYVQTIRRVGSETTGNRMDSKVSMTLRFPRNPVIGDKFSSRHGQKGVLSILWPQEDMPFSESGISPDVLINPHAFPSRMTIGMLVESMAGKAGALHGHYQDATPFSFHESSKDNQVSVDYFGEQLLAAGYNYYGSEPLYSGVSGCLMHADLFIGVVYYQRLRHMVSDKYQVRARGQVNPLTRQPIKGRKKGGGIRLGEMERDSLLSHGAAFCLHDRLLNCSDKHVAYACTRCGDMLLSTTERNTVLSTGQSTADAIHHAKLRLFCRNPACMKAASSDDDDGHGSGGGGNDEAVEPIIVPYVYRYLVNELAGMNIKLKLEIK